MNINKLVVLVLFLFSSLFGELLLNIAIEDTVINQNNSQQLVSVILKNNTDYTFKLFDAKRVTSGDYMNGYFWRLEIMYEDGKIMKFPENYYSPHFVIEKKYFKMIKPKEEYQFQFKIDFSKLFIGEIVFIDFNKYKNQKYGKYYIRLYYQDDYKIIKYTLPTIKSNIIVIEYVNMP